jgi:hypothetical protein
MKPALLVLAIFLSTVSAAQAEPDRSPKDWFLVLNDPLTGVQNRIKAINELNALGERELWNALPPIIRNAGEPAALRVHAIQTMLETKQSALKTMLKDAALDLEIRKSLLYHLWKKNPDGMKPELIAFAESPTAHPELRAAAVKYLGYMKSDLAPEYWVNLYLEQRHPTPVRIAALNALEAQGMLAERPSLVTQVVLQTDESLDLRKTSAMKAALMMPKGDLLALLLSILAHFENPLEMRQFALDNLAARGGEAELPKLKDLLAREKDVSLKNALEALIKRLTPDQ